MPTPSPLSPLSSTQPPIPSPGPGRGPQVEKNGLYILLWDTDLYDKYHWGLFIAQTPSSGTLFHQTNTGTDWKFIIEPIEDITRSEGLLAGLKLGSLEDVSEEWITCVKECLRETVVERGDFTCRRWALAGVYELADLGFVGMMPDWEKVWFVEEEAKRLARMARGMGVRIVVGSEMGVD